MADPPSVKTRSLNILYTVAIFLNLLLEKLISPHHFITTCSNHTVHIHSNCCGLCLVGQGLAVHCSPPASVYLMQPPLTIQSAAGFCVSVDRHYQPIRYHQCVCTQWTQAGADSIPQRRKLVNMDKMIYSTLQPGSYSHHLPADETCNPVTRVTQPPRKEVRSEVR